MALHKTANPHIRLSDTGTFRCFPKPYELGDWSDTTFNTFDAAEAWVRNNVTHPAPKAAAPLPDVPCAQPDMPPVELAPWDDQKPQPLPPVAVPSLPAAVPLPHTGPVPAPAPLPHQGAPVLPTPLPMPVPAPPPPPAAPVAPPPGAWRREDDPVLRAYQMPSPPVGDHLKIQQGFDTYPSQGPELFAQLLDLIEGGHADREGLQETPKRVVKAWRHWTSGYNVDIAALLKVFEDGAENYDEMVIVKDIPLYSKCEHHLADIFGTATVAYIPNGKVVGLSKISRLVDAFARRLQVQERLTTQIADALVEHLAPLGVGVVIKARHMCMESRGICQQGHHTVTSALRGVIKDQPQTRAEFLAIAK